MNDEPSFEEPRDPGEVLARMLARLNLCSREYVVRQFDHEVLAGSVVKPLAGRFQDVHTDAAVIRPLLDSTAGLALSHGLHPSYGDVDPYWMAACSIDTAVRNVVAVGADPDRVSLLDNFCWCSSSEPERLGQLKLAAQACYDMAAAYRAPFISGKDSMFNDFKGYDEAGRPVAISVPPTLLVSSLGIVEDVLTCQTPDAKAPGDAVYLLGTTRDELGGSEYYAAVGEALRGARFVGNRVPRVNPAEHMDTYRAFHRALREGLVQSSASLRAGGLALTACRTALAGDLGLELELGAMILDPPGLRPDLVLYSESQGRILATVAPEREPEFARLFQGQAAARVGRVLPEPVFRVLGPGGRTVLEVPLEKLREAYRKTLDG